MNIATIYRNNKERYVNKDMNNLINDIWKEYEDELNIQYGKTDFDFLYYLKIVLFPHVNIKNAL